MATPMNRQMAPSPTSGVADLVSPTASMATPATVSPVPQMVSRRSPEARSPSPGRSVRTATGGIRTARRAGPMAETTDTPVPTRRPTITVRDPNTSGPDGRVMPNPLISALSASAVNTPMPMPTAEEMNPTTAASASTEPNTWRRLAPTARSRASSRVRCPTMIENVL